MSVHIRCSQDGEEWFDHSYEIDRLVRDAYIFQPFQVETQDEKDYLDGLFLVHGASPVVLLEGRDTNPFDVPVTYTKVDL